MERPEAGYQQVTSRAGTELSPTLSRPPPFPAARPRRISAVSHSDNVAIRQFSFGKPVSFWLIWSVGGVNASDCDIFPTTVEGKCRLCELHVNLAIDLDRAHR